MKYVWIESVKQTTEMVLAWRRAGASGVASVARDTRTLSLNVLAATGFKRSYRFQSSSDPRVDDTESYRDALQTVLDNAIFLMLLPPQVLRLPFLPSSWTRIGKAAAAFQRYMMHMLQEETFLRDQGKAGTGSLMTSFVRALDTRHK